MKNQAREIYEQYFRAAEAMPRGVVAKIRVIVQHLETACAKQISQVKVVQTWYMFFFLIKRTVKSYFIFYSSMKHISIQNENIRKTEEVITDLLKNLVLLLTDLKLALNSSKIKSQVLLLSYMYHIRTKLYVFSRQMVKLLGGMIWGSH